MASDWATIRGKFGELGLVPREFDMGPAEESESDVIAEAMFAELWRGFEEFDYLAVFGLVNPRAPEPFPMLWFCFFRIGEDEIEKPLRVHRIQALNHSSQLVDREMERIRLVHDPKQVEFEYTWDRLLAIFKERLRLGYTAANPSEEFGAMMVMYALEIARIGPKAN